MINGLKPNVGSFNDCLIENVDSNGFSSDTCSETGDETSADKSGVCEITSDNAVARNILEAKGEDSAAGDELEADEICSEPCCGDTFEDWSVSKETSDLESPVVLGSDDK